MTFETRGKTVLCLKKNGRYEKAFRQMEEVFFAKVHPNVDLGLSLFEVLNGDDKTRHVNIFTFHCPQHIQKLIQTIDKFVENITSFDLTEEETYILLCAAHCHDVGNVYGRNSHEQYVYDLVHKTEYSGCFVADTRLKTYICDVASAHGGKHPLYFRDTLRSLADQTTTKIRLPLLAAILRAADELSEDPSRVPAFLSEFAFAETESPLCHAYSASLEEFEIRGTTLFVTYVVTDSRLAVQGTVAGVTLSFIDYLQKRIDKLEREIRYCVQYSRPALDVRLIQVAVEYREKNRRPISPVKRFSLPLLHGYPDVSVELPDRSPEIEHSTHMTLNSYLELP